MTEKHTQIALELEKHIRIHYECYGSFAPLIAEAINKASVEAFEEAAIIAGQYSYAARETLEDRAQREKLP